MNNEFIRYIKHYYKGIITIFKESAGWRLPLFMAKTCLLVTITFPLTPNRKLLLINFAILKIFWSLTILGHFE
jgi:diacylglycerol kinase